MTQKWGLALLGVIGLLLLHSGWKVYAPSLVQSCNACGRPLHFQTKTVASVGGQQEVFCCPTCPLTAQRQSGKIVRITELSDYETGKHLSPNDAYMVEGSAVSLCVQKHALVDQDNRAFSLVFDRCLPSLIAFASKDAAEKFSRRQGGNLLRFEELAAFYQQ